MRQFAFFLIIITVATSCKKDDNDHLIQGNLYNAETGNPIEGVRIGYFRPSTLFSNLRTSKTNKNGGYQLKAYERASYELLVYSVTEQIEQKTFGDSNEVLINQSQSHDLVCIDTINCQESYFLEPNTDYKIDFHLIPTGVVNFSMFNENGSSVDKIVLKFIGIVENEPNELIFTKTDINELNDEFRFFRQTIRFKALQDAMIIVEEYKNGSITKTTTHPIEIEEFKSIVVRIKI